MNPIPGWDSLDGGSHKSDPGMGFTRRRIAFKRPGMGFMRSRRPCISSRVSCMATEDAIHVSRMGADPEPAHNQGPAEGRPREQFSELIGERDVNVIVVNVIEAALATIPVA